MGVRERTAWAPSSANPPDVRAVPDDRNNYTSTLPDCQLFSEDFSRKIEKSKTKPPHRTFSPSVQERFLRHAGAGRVLFSDIGSPAFFFQEHRTMIPSFLQANAIISMELHFRCRAGCTA